jgi:thymidylate synthase (FAD)
MKVTLISHSQLSELFSPVVKPFGATDGEAVSLTAIRTCYSEKLPTEIVTLEGDKYFDSDATDGEGGSEADRLFRRIVNSGHTSTLEHLTFTFAIEGVSRALLAQLTRHRHFSFSVQSQRYVRLGSNDKSGGFDYVVPDKIANGTESMKNTFHQAMKRLQEDYDMLRTLGVTPEDARSVLPNATATNVVMTANLRSLLDFYSKRRSGRGAQGEIVKLAEELRLRVTEVEDWTDRFFEQA